MCFCKSWRYETIQSYFCQANGAKEEYSVYLASTCGLRGAGLGLYALQVLRTILGLRFDQLLRQLVNLRASLFSF